MEKTNWPTEYLSVASLFLDERNPRLEGEIGGRTQREIIQYLFDHDKALEVAHSIVARGYFENEPLLAISENGNYVVVEGNRRLAALKALGEPEILTEKVRRRVERISREADFEKIISVPVIIAPSRHETDPIIAGRHVGTPVLAWQAENRASFILSKLEEGYDSDQLKEELGFTNQDIHEARQTKVIADIVRAIDLPPEIKAKVEDPRAKLFSTLERVFDSQVGQGFLKIKPDTDHGFRGVTTKKEFVRALANLVTDIALKKETSRSLNTKENIRDYFERRNPKAVAAKKQRSFLPENIITGKSVSPVISPKPSPSRTKRTSQTVLPKDFKILSGNDRLIDIRRELVKLKRSEFPNAGAVLLRVFLELSIKDYLERMGLLEELKKDLESKNKLHPSGMPLMKQLAEKIVGIAKNQLSNEDAVMVEKALRPDQAAPFSISELNTFIHHTDFPTERDILQFWNRTEPLFRMMLEQKIENNT